MSTEERHDRNSYGLSLKKRGNSFHFDELIDSLGEDRSSQLATSLTANVETPTSLIQEPDLTAPTVPIVKSRSLNKANEKRGFFKRLFSNSAGNSSWASNSENQISEESSFSTSTASSKASRASKPAKRDAVRPHTTGSGVSGASESFGSSSSGRTTSFLSQDDSFVSSTRGVRTTRVPTSLVPTATTQVVNPVLSPAKETQAELILAPFVEPTPIKVSPLAGSYGLLSNDTLTVDTQQKSSKSQAAELPEGWRSVSPAVSHDRDDRPRAQIDTLVDSPALRDRSNQSPVTLHDPSLADLAQFGGLCSTTDDPTPSPISLSSPVPLKRVAAPKMLENDDYDTSTAVQIKATALYEWQDGDMHPSDYAAYLGLDEPFQRKVREAYFALFDFRGKSIVRALRQFCAKLYIRGETQVIDRVLESFSQRWHECNKQDRYLTQEVTHIIAFALITLNTDLHVANLENDQKMKKSAFTNNTLEAIRSGTTPDGQQDQSARHSVEVATEEGSKMTGEQTIRCVPRSGSLGGSQDIPSPPVPNRGYSSELVTAQAILAQAPPETGSTVVSSAPLRRKLTLRKSPSAYMGPERYANTQARDAYLREALQDMYISVKHEQIRQPDLVRFDRASGEDTVRTKRRPEGGDLHSLHGGSRARSLRLGDMMSRNSSAISLNTSNEYQALKAEVKAAQSNSNCVLDPNGETLIQSRTNSTSTLSGPRGLGFAGSLSNVIIREETTSMIKSPLDVVEAIEAAEEDDLTLHGAPFAKEGRLSHKLHDQSVSKKSRAKQWTSDTFAVLSKGEINLFDFSQKAMKMNLKHYGGGDWTQNARSLLELSLVQTVAAALPEGSYLKDRPHIWALTMPDGVVHLFHVGTEELVQEWISTANYWAARTTKEPLLGAVDNAEYGWGQCLNHLLQAPDVAEDTISTPTTLASSSASRKDSISNFSLMMNPEASHFDDIIRKYPGNRAVIREWHPDPTPRMMSSLPQDAQLLALQKFVAKLQRELHEQSVKRALLPQAFSPHHPNLVKAQINFDRRRQHWQSEVIKYKTYIEALEHGIHVADEVRVAKMNKNLRDLQSKVITTNTTTTNPTR